MVFFFWGNYLKNYNRSPLSIVIVWHQTTKFNFKKKKLMNFLQFDVATWRNHNFFNPTFIIWYNMIYIG